MPLKTDLPAHTFAKAWQTAALAASDDQYRPHLYRTVHLEVFDGQGVRLVATDSYMLVRLYVPFDMFDPNEPDPSEMPDQSYIVSDRDGRGLGLMKYVEKQVKAMRKREDDPDIEGALMISVVNVASNEQTFEGMASRALRLEWPERELVVCPLIEDMAFPDWRHLETKTDPLPTDELTFSPSILRRLGKMGNIYPGKVVKWTFNGTVGVVRFTLGEAQGMLMPVRPEDKTEEDDDEPVA